MTMRLHNHNHNLFFHNNNLFFLYNRNLTLTLTLRNCTDSTFYQNYQCKNRIGKKTHNDCTFTKGFHRNRKGTLISVASASILCIRRYFHLSSGCSLDQLASNIDLAYQYYPYDLSVEKVRSIKNSVRRGSYTLSPFHLEIDKNYAEMKDKYLNFYHLHDSNNNILYGGIETNTSDKLVLMALGFLLTCHIDPLDSNTFKKLSYGLREAPSSYYNNICSGSPISRLYKIDFTYSIFTLDKDLLYQNLYYVVNNDEIMDLIESILYKPVNVQLDGKDYTILNDSIPSLGFITDVLLNFYLIQLDNKFLKEIPCINLPDGVITYSRYVHELIITTKQEIHECDAFEAKLISLFESLNLKGHMIDIGPGESVSCYHDGQVCITEKGVVSIEVSKHDD